MENCPSIVDLATKMVILHGYANIYQSVTFPHDDDLIAMSLDS